MICSLLSNFYFFFWLFALAGSTGKVLNRSDEGIHPCRFYILSSSVSPVCIMLPVSICRHCLLNWRISSLFLICGEFLSWTDVELCQEFFSASTDKLMIFPLWPVNTIDFINFLMLNQPSVSYIPHLAITHNSLDVPMNSVCGCFIQHFGVYIYQRCWSVVLRVGF